MFVGEKFQRRLGNYTSRHRYPGTHSLAAYLRQLGEVLPKSAIGKALAYNLKQWDKLSLYATTAILNIDNNPVENSIRPVAVGRKNYLFAGSHAGAGRAAMFYSLLSTCTNYKINPYDRLHDVLNRMAAHPINRIEDLLPQNWKPNTT